MWMICLLSVISIFLITIARLYLTSNKKLKNVCIVVLGDLGRSPRMQFHAISFAKEGFAVNLIGYPGSLPLKEIRENAQIHVYYLLPPPNMEDKIARLPYYIIKTAWQAFTLLWILFSKNRSNYVMIQNPPAIPTIPICWFYCAVTVSKFIIDWHNYAHTQMALSLKNNHPLVKFAKEIEVYFGSKAYLNFCVSNAMKKDLQDQWGIKAHVFYDRPASNFKRISLKDKHEFLLKISNEYDVFKGSNETSTVFTECIKNDVIHLASNRPGFIISSTSWAQDEDFSILLNALQDYEDAIVQGVCKLPDLICVITGKGYLKEFYIALIKFRNWQHVKVLTPWLTSEDYPKMLASADLGICLHTSSSGLDLPMKVIDMFGCELPVCAYNFNCLPELVKHNENGMIFSNDKELATQLKDWFENFPNNESQQNLDKKFKEELHKFQENRWHGHSRSLFERNASLNDRPIIGVLAQEISYHLKSHFSEDYTSYIAASYVKFVEGAGARVVPIWIGKDKSYYENILSKVNGVLWPGGSTYFNQSNGYADAGHTIYKIARRMNNNGNYFPIFGICLGMELMTYLVANRTEHRIHCNSTNQPLPLEFLQGYRKGELFKNAPSNVISALRNEEVTGNYHQFCVTRKNLKNVGISEKFRVLSLNHDFNGEEFISSLEHVTFPFYGLQFHPEKNIYEWIEGKRIPHGETPVMVAQYFANFFVNEARKNDNRFPTVQEESESLIYNYPVQYTGLMKSAFVQCYVFKKNETRN